MNPVHLLIALATLLLAGNAWPTSSEKADYTGFWKDRCSDAYGIQIMPFKDGLYTARFCGPGGRCDTPPDPSDATPIEGDPKYEVVSPTEIKEKEGDTVYGVLHKCTTETNPLLKYSEEDIAQGRWGMVSILLIHFVYAVAATFVYRFLRSRVSAHTPFKTRFIRSGILAVLFSPGILFSFPFAAPTFALIALIVRLGALVDGNSMFVLPQIILSGIPILITWGILFAIGSLLVRFRKTHSDHPD